MALDTASLQCFISAAETGSFTKAALKVGRTQSAVSQQVSKLEKLIGKALLKRSKYLELTTEGEIFLSYAKQIFSLHHQTIEYFKKPTLKGEVKFGIPDDFASVFLYDFLSEFILTHPNISLHIECDLTIHLYDSFKKNNLDLVLLKLPCSNNTKFATKLSSQKLCWVGNENLTKNKDLLPLVLAPKPCVYHKEAITALAREQIKWQITFSSHSYSGIIAAVKAGLGITILPQKMVPKDLSIIPTLPNLQGSYLSLLKARNDNPAINYFENFVIKNIG